MNGNRKRSCVKWAICLALILFSLTGCGRLQSRFEVESLIRKALPDGVILKVETGMRSKNYKFKKYFIENKGVLFTYENYQGGNFFFAGTSTYSENDYCKKLFEYFEQEIGEITEKYQIKAEASGSAITLYNEAADMEGVGRGAKALQEIYLLLEDYIPQAELYWFPFSIKLWTDYGERQLISIHKQGDWDYDYYRQLLYLNFKSDVDLGRVSSVKLSQEWLDSIPQKYIQSLYINGEAYQSETYETQFIYNLEDGKYYARVGFGIEIDYNGGVEDYLQREIIEAYYPDAGYSISMKEHTSTYQIGQDRYLIKRLKDDLVFFKNGRELPVKSFLEVSGTHTGAAYYFWISVDDFASILGMSLEKVDENGVYLRAL